MSVTTRATEAYTALMSPPTSQYKGKLSNRSWQQLPPEIIRYVSSLSTVYRHTHPRFHNLPSRTQQHHSRSISLGEHGSEMLTYFSFSLHFLQPDCYQLPPRCLNIRILSSYLGCPGCLAIQDGLYLNPRRRTAREAHANMPTLVHRSYVSFHFALSSRVFVVPVWGVAIAPVLICGSDSCSITSSQSKYTPIGNKLA